MKHKNNAMLKLELFQNSLKDESRFEIPKPMHNKIEHFLSVGFSRPLDSDENLSTMPRGKCNLKMRNLGAVVLSFLRRASFIIPNDPLHALRRQREFTGCKESPQRRSCISYFFRAKSIDRGFGQNKIRRGDMN